MSIEQRRAQHALKSVRSLHAESGEFKKCYRAYVDRVGPAVIMNGLGQTLATEVAAAGPQPTDDRAKAHRKLYDNLQNWLCRESEGVYQPNQDLLESIVTHGEPYYLRAQSEALAWLEWHKKFCRATLPKGEED